MTMFHCCTPCTLTRAVSQTEKGTVLVQAGLFVARDFQHRCLHTSLTGLLLIRSVRIFLHHAHRRVYHPPPPLNIHFSNGCTCTTTAEKLARRHKGGRAGKSGLSEITTGCAPFNFIREEQAERRRSSRSMLGEAHLVPHRRSSDRHTHTHTHHRQAQVTSHNFTTVEILVVLLFYFYPSTKTPRSRST